MHCVNIFFYYAGEAFNESSTSRTTPLIIGIVIGVLVGTVV